MSLITKPNGLLSRAALLTSIGAVAILAIGYNSSAQAHRGPNLQSQALPSSVVQNRTGQELPSFLKNPDTAFRQRQSIERAVQPGYGIRVCCPPMTPALMADTIAFVPGQNLLGDYSIKYATQGPGATYYPSVMQGYTQYLGAIYGGSATLYSFYVVREKSCEGPLKGWIGKIFNPGFAGEISTWGPPANTTAQNLQVNTDYYIQPLFFIWVQPKGREGFWLKQECSFKCIKIRISVVGARQKGAPTVGTEQSRTISTDNNVLLQRRDANDRVLQGGNLGELRVGLPVKGEISPEASACESCAN
jgi:hypothetical protein